MSEVEVALARLQESIGLWIVSQRDPFRLVLAACDAVSVGIDSPSLLEIASRSKSDSTFDFPELTSGVTHELGLPPLEPDAPETQIAAAKAKSRQFLAGEIEASDLTGWAHRMIGHLGPTETDILVNLDDERDVSITDEAFASSVRSAAESILAL